MLTINEIKETITRLVKDYPISRVILFGSYARGDATERSDVDLIIDSEGRLSALEFFGIVGIIVETIPISVDVFELDEVKKPSKMFDQIRSEGVVIYES